MKAFLTGGAGYVGRNLISMLREKGYSVVALVRSEKARVTVCTLGAEAVQGDLADVDAMAAGMRGCDVVFHLAAHTKAWSRSGKQHFEENVQGTQNVIVAARSARVPKMVHMSTEAVLTGGAPLHRVDETFPYPSRSAGLYPETKKLAEIAALKADSPELKVVVVRPRFIWGKDDTTLLPALVEAVKTGKFMWINHGRYLSSTCHVDNVCEGTILAADRGRGGEIYFLTDGEPIEFRALLTKLLATQNITPPNKSIPYGLAYAIGVIMESAWNFLPLPGEPPIHRTVLRIIGEEVTVSDAKARRELGYEGKMPTL